MFTNVIVPSKRVEDRKTKVKLKLVLDFPSVVEARF